jgi:predicted enzyme related to lactoylglutathione lyase
MTDPLDALRVPPEPVDPDPIFAARLRDRLRDALLAGGFMTETTSETTGATTTDTADLAWGPSIQPYIAVRDGRRALDWYVEVFGAERRGEPYVMPDGSIGHAELGIGDGVLMLSEGSTEVPVGPPQPGAPHSHSIFVEVSDVDGTVRHARELGASVEREPVDQPYGRVAVIVDPFDHRWMLNQPPPRATKQRTGDVSYITMAVPDDERAKEFYGAVLGWRFAPGSVEHGWQVGGVRPHMGLWGGADRPPEVQLCYRVSDIASALDRVREHGGTAGEVERKPYGLMAECEDDQGTHFQLWEPVD